MSNPSDPQTVAAANALKGERSFATLHYPLTGDPELDFISGVLVLSRESPLTPSALGDALIYLFKRVTCGKRHQTDWQDTKAELEKLYRSMQQAVPNPFGTTIGTGLANPAPTPLPYVPTTLPPP